MPNSVELQDIEVQSWDVDLFFLCFLFLGIKRTCYYRFAKSAGCFWIRPSQTAILCWIQVTLSKRVKSTFVCVTMVTSVMIPTAYVLHLPSTAGLVPATTLL